MEPRTRLVVQKGGQTPVARCARAQKDRPGRGPSQAALSGSASDNVVLLAQKV